MEIFRCDIICCDGITKNVHLLKKTIFYQLVMFIFLFSFNESELLRREGFVSIATVSIQNEHSNSSNNVIKLNTTEPRYRN